jgi:hypothetical protein
MFHCSFVCIWLNVIVVELALIVLGIGYNGVVQIWWMYGETDGSPNKHRMGVTARDSYHATIHARLPGCLIYSFVFFVGRLVFRTPKEYRH